MSEGKGVCGIVMPISSIDGCGESHWADVQEVLSEAIDTAGFEANLVSNADDVGIIHKRIIQNLYENPIVVCDVSGKNPNVMFELGMRLAFDKPTIIVKDDKTSYSFDTSAIEHIEYPRDLRFTKIVEFKQKLSSKIKATVEKSISDPEHTTFLKHFGEFKVAKIDSKEVTGQEFIIDELKSLKTLIKRLEKTRVYRDFDEDVFFHPTDLISDREIDLCLRNSSLMKANELLEMARSFDSIMDAKLVAQAADHYHLLVTVKEGVNIAETASKLQRKSQIRRILLRQD